jgi:biotin operon repressor
MKGISCLAALKALSEHTRLRILRVLLKDQLSVNTISRRLKLTQYNVSKHLRILREAGLLETEKQGQQRGLTPLSFSKARPPANPRSAMARAGACGRESCVQPQHSIAAPQPRTPGAARVAPDGQ